MKKITAFFISLAFCIIANAQDKSKWTMIPNLSLKGENGLLIVSLPVQAAVSFTVTHHGDPKILYSWHTATKKDLPPGNYDIIFWNIKIPVVIEKQKETRILAGVLNSTVKKPWEVWSNDSTKIFSAGSAKMVALPAGKYILKTGSVSVKTNITDGQVSIFSYTAN